MLRSNFLFLLLLLSVSVGIAQDFTVDAYTVDITIHKDGYFDVVENYDVNFTYHKHGIYRNINTFYNLKTETGAIENREIQISKVEVPGHRFESTGKFGQKFKKQAQIKIGDPNKTIIGPVHYEIKYRVENAFLFEQNHTRFYWNLKPPDWDATFQNVQFTIHVPNEVSLNRNDVKIYSGSVGTTSESTDFTVSVTSNEVRGTSIQDFISYRGDALTVLINLPTDSIAKHEPLWPFWSHYGWILILLLMAGGFYWLFTTYGKDAPAPAVISYFPPDSMDPAMVGFLIDDKEDTSDLIALLPYWGNQGLIEIEEIDKKGWFAKDDTRIKKIADIAVDAPDYQRTIFNGLFGYGETEVLVSDLKNSFYTTMGVAKRELHKAAQVYYDPKARRIYWLAGIGIVLSMIILAPLFFYFWGFIALFSLLGLGVTLLILNRFMIKKNPKGIKLLSELKGFKMFIRTAEENRLKMLLKEDPSYFESTMAYALAFGAFAGWASKFEKLNVPPPSWYHYAGTQMSMHHFSQSFSNTIRATSTTMVSSPSSSSSGGGSSGGGFGGGGGGSW